MQTSVCVSIQCMSRSNIRSNIQPVWLLAVHHEHHLRLSTVTVHDR